MRSDTVCVDTHAVLCCAECCAVLSAGCVACDDSMWEKCQILAIARRAAKRPGLDDPEGDQTYELETEQSLDKWTRRPRGCLL